MELTNGQERRALRLEAFRVQDFRSFGDAELSLEPDVTVLVGLNDVGKSSLLDALQLYGAIVKSGFRVIARQPELNTAPAEPVLSARWRELSTDEVYEHQLTCDPRAPRESLKWSGGEYHWDPRERRLRIEGQEYSAKGMRRFDSLGAVAVTDWRTESDVPDEISDRIAIVRGFLTPTPYLFEPSRLALGVPLSTEIVSRSGAGWVILLQDIINRRDGGLEYLEASLRELFPFFRRVILVEERYEVTRRITTLHDEALTGNDSPSPMRDGGLPDSAMGPSERRLRFEVGCPARDQTPPEHAWVPAEAMSSGLLLSLAYLTVAVSNPEGSLLALEEPANGLNPRITLQMMATLLRVVHERRHQLLMTTHNGLWLDQVRPEGIRVVTRDENGSHVRSDPGNYQRIRDKGFYLSEVMNLGGPEQLLEKPGGQD